MVPKHPELEKIFVVHAKISPAAGIEPASLASHRGRRYHYT